MGSLSRRIQSALLEKYDLQKRQRIVALCDKRLKGDDWTVRFEATGDTKKSYRLIVKRHGVLAGVVDCEQELQVIDDFLEKIAAT